MTNSWSIHGNSCSTKKDKIMKKQYINPQTIIVSVEVQQMIAESTTAAINRDVTVDDENSIESRLSFSIWDDDED